MKKYFEMAILNSHIEVLYVLEYYYQYEEKDYVLIENYYQMDIKEEDVKEDNIRIVSSCIKYYDKIKNQYVVCYYLW